MTTRMKMRIIAASMIALALALSACGGEEPVKGKVLTGAVAPGWVERGGGAYSDSHGRAFFGVGESSGLKNLSLLRSNADNRARAEVSKIFQFYTAALMRDYLASKKAIEPMVSDEERRVEEAMRDLTSSALSGVIIVEQWHNPDNGKLFALARLDLDAFMELAEKSPEIDKSMKDYIDDNAERLHGEIGAGFDSKQ